MKSRLYELAGVLVSVLFFYFAVRKVDFSEFVRIIGIMQFGDSWDSNAGLPLRLPSSGPTLAPDPSRSEAALAWGDNGTDRGWAYGEPPSAGTGG